jgi:PAS domain S-box-containing protein
MDIANDSAQLWRKRAAQLVMQPFAVAVSQSAIPTIFADTTLDDVAIVFANASFLRLTGWEEDEVLGRNLRFLNGPETDPEVAARIERAMAMREAASVDVRLDRKCGRGFWARLDVAPVFDPDGRARLLFATLVDVSDRVRVAQVLRDTENRFETRVEERTVALETALERTELLTREITHRTKNALALLGALIEAKRRAARTEGEAALLGDVSQRVRAIGRLQGLLDGLGSEVHGLELGRFLGELVEELDAPTAGNVAFEGAPGITIPAESALALALCITELVLNAQIDRHRLGEVARLVHVRALGHRRVIGQKLRRDRVEDGREESGTVGHHDPLPGAVRAARSAPAGR